MTELTINQEKLTSIPSRELRALRAEVKKLQYELEKERGSNGMLLYLLGRGRDCEDEKSKLLITLQEKVNRAIAMLELSDDPADVLKMLTEKVDFLETHHTFLLGMNEWKEMQKPSEQAE